MRTLREILGLTATVPLAQDNVVPDHCRHDWTNWSLPERAATALTLSGDVCVQTRVCLKCSMQQRHFS